MKNLFKLLLPAVCLLTGCASHYTWTSKVPADMRTVCVPTFINKSGVQEVGAVATTQVLREFQREGTFKLVRNEDAIIEVQGEVIAAYAGALASSIRSGQRVVGYDYKLMAIVSIIDHKNGRVLVNNKLYTGSAPLTSRDDIINSQRGNTGAAANDLARQIVDDVLNMKW